MASPASIGVVVTLLAEVMLGSETVRVIVFESVHLPDESDQMAPVSLSEVRGPLDWLPTTFSTMTLNSRTATSAPGSLSLLVRVPSGNWGSSPATNAPAPPVPPVTDPVG